MKIEYIIAIGCAVFIVFVIGFLVGDLYGHHKGYYKAQNTYRSRHKEEMTRLEKQCSLFRIKLFESDEKVCRLEKELAKANNKANLKKEINEKMKDRGA